MIRINLNQSDIPNSNPQVRRAKGTKWLEAVQSVHSKSLSKNCFNNDSVFEHTQIAISNTVQDNVAKDRRMTKERGIWQIEMSLFYTPRIIQIWKEMCDTMHEQNMLCWDVKQIRAPPYKRFFPSPTERYFDKIISQSTFRVLIYHAFR